MITGLTQTIDRGWASGARTLIASFDASLDPAVAMQLQQLLTHRFAGQSELVCELRDRGRTALLQSREDRAPAIRQLFDRENGYLLLPAASNRQREKFRKVYFARFLRKRCASLDVESSPDCTLPLPGKRILAVVALRYLVWMLRDPGWRQRHRKAIDDWLRQ